MHNHGGGGNGDRKDLMKLATKIFDVLGQIEPYHSLVTPDGKVIAAKKLCIMHFRPLLKMKSMSYYTLPLVNPTRDCPLKDFTGSCVEFLSDADAKKLSVDMGRLQAHLDQIAQKTKELSATSPYSQESNDRKAMRLTFAHDEYLRMQLIHEAMRLAQVEDRNYEYSEYLGGEASIFEQFTHGQSISFFMETADPCLDSTKKKSDLTADCDERYPLPKNITVEPADEKEISVKDLIGAHFYDTHTDGNYFTFTTDGQGGLLASERYGRQEQIYPGFDLFLWQDHRYINATSMITCIPKDPTYKGHYVQISAFKFPGAPLFL